jgi:hypothetical protein
MLNESQIKDLLAERDNLLQIANVREKKLTALESTVYDLSSTLAMLNNDMITMKKILGVVELEARLKEIEYRIEAMSFDTNREYVESVLDNWMETEFDVERHLNDVYDWSRFIDYVDSDNIGEKIREVIDELTFTVRVE